MIATLDWNGKPRKIDFSKPLDISIPLRASDENVNAWYLKSPKIEPVKMDDWVGSVKDGADVNFNNIYFNPHAHGTHTECVGHITEKVHSINEHLTTFFFSAKVISVEPQTVGEDFIIQKEQIKAQLQSNEVEALVIRTLPNHPDKLSKHYSNTNPPFISEDAALFIKDSGIKHLLIDLPSVDKEKDDGKLLSHNAFWNTTGNIRFDATITEFIYVPNTVEDGLYSLNLQIAPFENDATPSKPILYKIFD
ncbi:Kynurenine formamidase [Flavobacteriaceae bacterium MAR_2010_188]|nr:Kynurenine formamidase [Flavobacteriaceae bacterium MAR_2010_188]